MNIRHESLSPLSPEVVATLLMAIPTTWTSLEARLRLIEGRFPSDHELRKLSQRLELEIRNNGSLAELSCRDSSFTGNAVSACLAGTIRPAYVHAERQPLSAVGIANVLAALAPFLEDYTGFLRAYHRVDDDTDWTACMTLTRSNPQLGFDLVIAMCMDTNRNMKKCLEPLLREVERLKIPLL